MPPRSRRMAAGKMHSPQARVKSSSSALEHRSSEDDDDPLAMNPIQRKKMRRRKSAVKVDGAGSSGWNGMALDVGSGNDLVPPSDEEEFELWRRRRAEASKNVSPVPEDQRLEGSARVLNEGGNVDEAMRSQSPEQRFHTLFPSPTPSTESGHISVSPETSQTIPLSFSQNPEETVSFQQDAEIFSQEGGILAGSVTEKEEWAASDLPSPQLFATAPGVSPVALITVNKGTPPNPAILHDVHSHIGPHNAHLFTSPLRPVNACSPSPARLSSRAPNSSPSESLPPISPLARHLVRSPVTASAGNIRFSYPSSPPPLSVSNLLNRNAEHLDAVPSTPHSTHSPVLHDQPVPPSPALRVTSPADPALHRFRTARTFRTRTVLQLQPYTKERQIYEAALRRGGLKKGKRAIADSRVIGRGEEDHEEEGGNDDSTEAEDTPDRIVIGGSPDSVKQPEARAPKPLIKDDFDEYFLEYGEAANENDTIIADRLQQIATRRLRDQKVQRKKAREAMIAKRRFESLLTHPADGGLVPRIETPLLRPATSRRPRPRTPGRPTTYAKQGRPPLQSDHTPASDSDVLPDQPSPLSPPRFTQPSSADSGVAALSFRAPTTDFVVSDMGFEPELFFVDDLPPSATKRRTSQLPSSGSSGSESSTSHQDRRAKIAKRMLPAAMLRRLERDADENERRRAENKQRRTRPESPLKPGIAVTRRAQGDIHFQDFVEVLQSDDDVSDDIGAPSPVRSGRVDRQQELVVISDDSLTGSSQAHGFNGGEETLARLYDGDFESIVTGKRVYDRRQKRSAPAPRSLRRQKHPRRSRPGLGPVKRDQRRLGDANRAFVQTRLDFASTPDSSGSRRCGQVRKEKLKARTRGRRPAIRLHDHVIFSTADFDFEEDHEEIPARPPRRFQRTVSKTALVPDGGLDVGIGKARSWANFDKFPIGFEIIPLPSGIYCNPRSFVGDGGLARLVRLIRYSTVEASDTCACYAYGVELRSDMTPMAVAAVLPLVTDGIIASAVAFINSPDCDPPCLSPLDFVCEIIPTFREEKEGAQQLLSACRSTIKSISSKLDDLSVSSGTPNRPVREALLRLRWSLLNLSLRLCVVPYQVSDVDALIPLCGVAVLRQLFAFGFDKTIRPLKSILRAEVDNPEITDLSIVVWISILHALPAWDQRHGVGFNTFSACLDKALDSFFRLDQTGPIAAERVWFLIFGLCALSQFDVNGRIASSFVPIPRWPLVRRAIGFIKISHNEEAEERAHVDQLRGRDRYIKAMVSRCVRLSSVWRWSFDRDSFSVATRDLGTIFKDRQYRNLPTEQPVDYPEWLSDFNMSLTAVEDSQDESAFELYLRLVCVAASDIIASAQSLTEAQQAEKDVQRLIMSIIPVSPVKFSRILPPTARQLGQLINRYSTMAAACYFSPSLLSWLLANSRKWAPFEQADFGSRQISVRGLMYLAVACRHHRQPLGAVVARLVNILAILQKELDESCKPSKRPQAPTRLEAERTMVLVVSCFRQIIVHHSFDTEEGKKPVYPDPCLLNEGWTGRIFSLDLANDHRCAGEVVSTIQAFLDIRASALPRLARQRREALEVKVESQDDFSFGIDFTSVDLAALGGNQQAESDPIEKQDEEFAKIITIVISPQIYRLLSDMLPAVEDKIFSVEVTSERQAFIGKLTKCWSDCAGVVAIEQASTDGWTPYIGAFGSQSWQRLRSEQGRLQVGLHFMLNVAKLDGGAFGQYQEDFISLLFQTITTDKLTIEHQFLSALFATPGFFNVSLLSGLAALHGFGNSFDEISFMNNRAAVLDAIFSTIPGILSSPSTPSSTKAFVYRCINLLVSSLVNNEKSIDPKKVIHRESYHAFAVTTVRDLRRLAGEYITPLSVPGLKQFVA